MFQFLACDVFKSVKQINPEFMWSYFKIKSNQYSLRNGCSLMLPTTKSITYGINSIVYRGSAIWNSLPSNLKLCITVPLFKNKIKNLKELKCSCSACT